MRAAATALAPAASDCARVHVCVLRVQSGAHAARPAHADAQALGHEARAFVRKFQTLSSVSFGLPATSSLNCAADLPCSSAEYSASRRCQSAPAVLEPPSVIALS